MSSLRSALFVPALLLSACAFAQVSGNGVAREETREVADFTGVEVSSGLSAKVTVGPKSVRISGDENLVALVRTKVDDGKLEISLDKDSRVKGSSKLRITISSPQVTSVSANGGSVVEAEASASSNFAAEASGGGEVDVRNLDAKALAVDASGGAVVKVKGRADALAVDASGGSEVHAQELSVKTLAVDASGGCVVKANPSESIAAELSGGSTVHVDSSPGKRAVSTSGGSEVIFSKK
jgi:hypothetical protein